MSLPLDHGTIVFGVESPGVAPGSSACDADIFLLDHDPKAEAVGLEPTNGKAVTCFQDRLLIRSDGFREAPGVGIEPTTSWFRARRHYQQQLPRIVVTMTRFVQGKFGEEGSNLRLLPSRPESLPLADPRSRSRVPCGS